MGRKTATSGGDGGAGGYGDDDPNTAGSSQGNPMMPMMMGGMPGMAMPMMNPMMMGMMNPMMGMMMMQAGMRQMAQAGAQAQPDEAAVAAAAAAAAGEQPKLIDPKVKAICRDFSINDDICAKLHDAMKDREDFDEDIQALHKVMERSTRAGRKPLEAMLMQIRAIKAGRFAGKELLDPDIWAFIEKYNLDDRVINRLIETLKKSGGKRKEDLKSLDERLNNASQPTGLGLLVRLLEGLEETGRLPSPPRRLGGSGHFHPTGTFLHPSGPGAKGGGGRGRNEDRGSDRRHSDDRRYPEERRHHDEDRGRHYEDRRYAGDDRRHTRCDSRSRERGYGR